MIAKWNIMSDFEYDYLGSLAKRNAILLCKDDQKREYLKLLARTYQCIIVAETIENEADGNGSKLDQKDAFDKNENQAVDLLLINYCSNMEFTQNELSKISSYLTEHQIEAVVWAGLDDLDEVYASLPASQCHFLIDSDPLEAMPALTGLTGRDVMNHLSDISQDESNEKEYATLHKISGELASLAKTLAQIVDSDDDNSSAAILARTPQGFSDQNGLENSNDADSIARTNNDKKDNDSKYSNPDDYMNHSVFKDKPVSFSPFPNKSTENSTSKPVAPPFIENGDKYASHDSEISADMVRAIIKKRRLRDNYFVSALFADPAWDILLDLMAARLSGQTVSVSSLCIAAAVPATTALRWITSMTKNGMLERKSDPMDARRVFIDLSDETFKKLEAYLIKVSDHKTSII